MLTTRSESTRIEEVKAAALTFKEKVAEVLACKRRTVREKPSKLDATQVTAGRNLHFPRTLCVDYRLYESCGRISLRKPSMV